ncbi:MAG TPA: FtsX-like permease family protein [Vicinamibacterales bacterium]|nr:FtsX-like permease family protein [Vicinamibacterales bacterium]
MVGVYGLVANTVGRRVQEFGLRLALGAAPRSLILLVLVQGLRLAVLGVALGLAGAWFATRLGESMLFEVSARDPVAFITAPAVLVAATVVACWAPARRALGVNPIQAPCE